MHDNLDENNIDEYIDRVRSDHFRHWIATISAILYAWQLYGWVFAILLWIGLIIVIASTNTLILYKYGNFRWVRINRWFWIVIVFFGLALSAAEICHGSSCESIWGQ